MLFRVLGPVEVGVAGASLALGPPRQRALLGVLVLHRGELVLSDRLVDALWDHDPPRTASHSVQSYVSGLRGVLGADRIETRGSGYVLHAACEEVDACRFEGLMTEGLRAAESGDPETAVQVLAQALEWWRGDPLMDVPAGVSLAGELARLDELHLRAVETWAEAQITLGRHEDVLPELERLTVTYPLRERLWGHRLLALYRAGRPADALRAYQQLRTRLVEELGVDPSAELESLYERILLQDPHLRQAAPIPHGDDVEAEVRNPYRGLRAFTEDEAADFFGRDELVRDLLRVLSDEGRDLLAVVGPSGSGKSSVVRAGLIPALRRGALPELQGPTMVTMLPGTDPFDALAAAAGTTPPASDGVRWLVELLDRPAVSTPLVLVIDQFEELFTLVADAASRWRFLDGLTVALDERSEMLRVVVTLRADFFDRPLGHPGVGRRMTAGMVVALPLTAEQLEAAATGPARRVGLALEPGLITELVADLAGQPGALPLFQYTLTELFERRQGNTLTLTSYRALGGIDGAVSRRADDLYGRLTTDEQAVARQLFLRLVHPGEHTSDGRRRVPASEIAALDIDPVAMQTVLDRFGRARLLSFDRDLRTGAATVEIAHDALLEAWRRLRAWVEEARDDLRRRAGLASAVAEWRAADRDPDYLLVGARLASYEQWAATAVLRLTTGEQSYLAASTARRDHEQAAEDARRREEARLRRRSGRRLWSSVAAIAVVVLVAAVAIVSRPGGTAPNVALIHGFGEDGGFEQLFVEGMAQLERRFDVVSETVVPLTNPGDALRSLCAAGFDLVFVGGFLLVSETLSVAPECPDTMLVMLDAVGLEELELPPNVLPVTFATDEGSFLAGAAAALKTRSGIVGFIGGQPVALIEEFRAGFEAGAALAAPDVAVVATYVTHRTSDDAFHEAFGNRPLGALAARQLYEQDADVVYAVAGESGRGVLDAAIELSAPGMRRWVVGVDTDWHLTEPTNRARHVLTSMVKRFDVAMADVMQAFVDDELTSEPRRYTLGSGGVELSSRGGALAVPATLALLRQQLIDREVTVPTIPSGTTLPAPTERRGQRRSGP